MTVVATGNKKNYSRELEDIIKDLPKTGRRKLLLHSCCGPCSTYCLEYLSVYFDITVFYYNPNITDNEEYLRRSREQERFINSFNNDRKGTLFSEIKFINGPYEPEKFLETAKGLEKEPEGGKRCEKCFELRLSKAAEYGKANGFDYFTTTLTISPLKNAPLLNEIGEKTGKEYGIEFLPSDFKKKNGYKRSVELSAEYELYRQDYCGCPYSKAERLAQLAQKEKTITG